MYVYNQKLLTCGLASLIIVGCGGENSANAPDLPQTASFSMAISDAPVDDLSAVLVCFSNLELKSPIGDTFIEVGASNSILPANSECIDAQNQVVPNTIGINLLDYTGSNSLQLVEGLEIPAGDYTQLRLEIATGSYAELSSSGENVEVKVPSNELKLDGFTAAVGSVIDFTLEFDLRMAMTNPLGQDLYFLKPRGVRLVNNLEVGTIVAEVSETVLINNLCEPLASANVTIATLYLYNGANLTAEDLADIGGNESSQAITVSAVKFDASQTKYMSETGFVQLGDYTMALTCTTEDDPEANDDISFISIQNVSLTNANENINVIF